MLDSVETAIVVGVIGALAAVVTGLGGILIGHWLGRGSAKEDRLRAARLEEIEHTLRYGNAQLDQTEAAVVGSGETVARLGEAMEQQPWANFGLLDGPLADELVDTLVLARQFAISREGDQKEALKRIASIKLRLHERLLEQRLRILRGEDLLGVGAGLTPEDLDRRVEKLATAMDAKRRSPRIY